MAIYRNGVCVSAGGGSSGTTDYTDLENKPKINSIELSGNKSLSDLGVASSANLTAHTSDTSNPHSVTKSQIGLGNVDNTADLAKPVSTATQTALNGKVDKVDGKSLSSNDYTTTEKNKLAGIAAGAEVNVQSDWDATAGDALILHKPSSFPPSAHASTHASDGTDPITPASIGALPDTTSIPSALADLTGDSTHRTVTDAEKSTWNAKQSALTFDTAPTQDSVNPVTSGGVYSALNNKVDKISGKSLSSNDYTTAEKSKLSGIATGAEVNVLESVKDAAGTAMTITGKAVTLSKSAVGLSNVDNTSDLAKPVSTATQTALNTKVDKVSGKTLSTNDYTTAEKDKLSGIASGAQVNVLESVKDAGGTAMTITSKSITLSKSAVGLSNVDNTSDLAKPVSTATQTALSNKVDKVSGKSLSSNDYTTAEKDKLAGIEAGADVNVLESIKDASGAAMTITAKSITLSKTAVGLSNVDNTADSAKTFAATQITSEKLSIARIPTGDTENSVCIGNDARLSNSRNPNAHATTHNIGGTDAIAAASSSSNGLLSSTDWTTFNSKQNALTFDATPTASSINPVTSGGIYSQLVQKQNLLPTGILYSIPARASLEKTNRDANGVYLTYTWEILSILEDRDIARKWVSTLASDYLSRTLVIYDASNTVLASYLFTRTLDEYGNLVKEELTA